MIINIDDTTNLKRIILEFDDSIEQNQEINISNNNSTSKRKITNHNSRQKESKFDNTDVPIDFKDILESTEISKDSINQEIIEKPVIPDINRDIKIANNMQNLKI